MSVWSRLQLLFGLAAAKLGRRPLPPLAVAVALGSYLGLAADSRLAIASASILLPTAILAMLMGRSARALSIYPLAAMLTAAFTFLSSQAAERNSLRPLLDGESAYAELRGMVAYQPACYDSSRPGGDRRCYFELELDSLRHGGNWRPISGRLRVRIDRKPDDAAIRYGERWQLGGVVAFAERNGGYLRHRQPTLDVRASEAARLSEGKGSALIAFCLDMRAAAGRLLARGLESRPQELGLLKALLLGQREELDRSTYESFAATGTVHILAISGLHVGLIAFFIVAVLRWIGLPRTRWYLFLIPLLTLYTIGTGMRASAIRACLMASIYWLAPALKRKPDAICALSLAAILILWASPDQILDPGFQFSFAIVAGILLLLPTFRSFARIIRAPDPMSIESESRLARLLRNLGQEAYFLLAISVTAWLISNPLSMYYANNFAPIAVLANLFVVPLISCVVGIGGLTLLLGSFLPPLAMLFNQINRLLLGLLIDFVGAVANIPGGRANVLAPPVWQIALYYLLLCGGFKLRAKGLRILCMLALAALLGQQTFLAGRMANRIEVRDCGECCLALIELRGGERLLVNTGPSYRAYQLDDFLRGRGVNRIDKLLLSRVDHDHAGALGELLADFAVGEILIPDHAGRSRVYAELDKLDEEIALHRLGAGEILELPQGFEIEILNPAKDHEYRSSARAGLAFRLAKADFAMIFASGAELDRRLLDQPCDLAAPIWVIEDCRLSDSALSRVREYRPQSLVCGGESLPAYDGETRLHMLRRDGPAVLSPE